MTQEDNDFNFQVALKAIQKGQPLLGKEGILTPRPLQNPILYKVCQGEDILY